MKRLIVALLALWSMTAAAAPSRHHEWTIPLWAEQVQANTILQYGQVTPMHAAAWFGNLTIGDAGTAQSSNVSTIGATGLGNIICANSAAITAPYYALCLDASDGILSYTAYNGATAKNLNINVNGTTGLPLTFLPAAPAVTILGNPTGSQTTVEYFTINGLNQVSPNANNDLLLLYQASSGTLKAVTVANVANAEVAGVTSIGGFSGAFTLGSGLTATSAPAIDISTNGITNTLLAQMAADTVKCNNTGSQANASDCTSLTFTNLTLTGTLAVTGNVTLAGTLGVTGAATFSDGLSVASGLTVSTGGMTISAGGLTVTGTTTLNTALTVPNGGTGDSTLTAHGVCLGEGTSAITVTSAGTAGQILESNGASSDPSFQTSTSAMVLLNTISPGGTTTAEDLTSMTSAYTNYEIVLDNLVPATTSNGLALQYYAGGSVQNTNYVNALLNWSSAATATQSQTVYVPLTSDTNNVLNSQPGVSGTIRIYNPSGASAYKHMTAQTSWQTTAPAAQGLIVSNYWSGSTEAVTGFAMTWVLGGNFSSGTVKVYGIQ